MEVIIKAASVGICGSVLILLIRKSNPELGLLTAIAASCLIFILGLKLFSSVEEVIDIVKVSTGLNGAYTAPIIKCVGIGLTTKLSADICKDAGQSAISSAVDLCGAICAIYVSLPLIKTFLRMIGDLV